MQLLGETTSDLLGERAAQTQNTVATLAAELQAGKKQPAATLQLSTVPSAGSGATLQPPPVPIAQRDQQGGGGQSSSAAQAPSNAQPRTDADVYASAVRDRSGLTVSKSVLRALCLLLC